MQGTPAELLLENRWNIEENSLNIKAILFLWYPIIYNGKIEAIEPKSDNSVLNIYELTHLSLDAYN